MDQFMNLAATAASKEVANKAKHLMMLVISD